MGLSGALWYVPLPQLYLEANLTKHTQLLLTCGTENALLTVAELEKCEYQFTGTTPALCLPVAVDMEGKGRDEL
jgi:Glucosidase II beta subunit-like protein